MPKVTMPQLGESVAEGTIGKWLKQVGDHVGKYEPIVEVVTDKVNAEVPSPFEGTLTKILVEEGQTVPNNAEIAVIEAAGEAEQASSGGGDGPAATVAEASGGRAALSPSGSESPPSALGVGGASDGSEGIAPEGRTVLGTAGQGNGHAGGYEGRMTPAVRRLAREHGVDLSLIRGTGHAGRVTREDVLAYVERQRTGGGAAVAEPSAAQRAAAPVAQPAPATDPPLPAGQVDARLPVQTGAPADRTTAAAAGAPARPPTTSAPAAPTATPSPPAAPAAAVAAGQDELKPPTPMRRAIATHMVKSKQTAPHAYTTVEVDMSGVVALRESMKRQYQAREGVALSYVAIVAKAVVEALRKHRDLNAHWTDEGLVRKAAVNLGIAVAVDDGLIVPVIRNADQFSIHGLNLWVQDFAARARANRLRLDDVQGGTFTLNNTGWFGSVASQPIINVPEVAILSMEAIVKRPVVIETPQGDTIGIRPMMNVCVSFDHRGTDGAQVGRFVQDVRRWLESVDSNTPIW